MNDKERVEWYDYCKKLKAKEGGEVDEDEIS